MHGQPRLVSTECGAQRSAPTLETWQLRQVARPRCCAGICHRQHVLGKVTAAMTTTEQHCGPSRFKSNRNSTYAREGVHYSSRIEVSYTHTCIDGGRGRKEIHTYTPCILYTHLDVITLHSFSNPDPAPAHKQLINSQNPGNRIHLV